MNVRISENLSFQKKHFPNIYEQYIENSKEKQNDVDSKIEEIELNIKNQILIVCENYEEILIDVLNLSYDLQENLKKDLKEIESYNTIMIHNSYIEKFKNHSSKNLLELDYIHGYNTKFYDIKLVKKVSNKMLKNAVVIVVIKKLDIFSELSLKGIDYTKLEPNDKIGLKELLINFKSQYSLQKFIEQDFIDNKKNINKDSNTLIGSSYQMCFSLEICKFVNKNINIHKTSRKVYVEINTLCLKEYSNHALEIMKIFIKTPEFNKNFSIVQIYFEMEKKFTKDIKEFIFKVIASEVNYIVETNKTNVDIYQELLKGRIMELDGILKEQIKELYSTITNKIEKVNLI